jgi:hypothetical protein
MTETQVLSSAETSGTSAGGVTSAGDSLIGVAAATVTRRQKHRATRTLREICKEKACRSHCVAARVAVYTEYAELVHTEVLLVDNADCDFGGIHSDKDNGQSRNSESMSAWWLVSTVRLLLCLTCGLHARGETETERNVEASSKAPLPTTGASSSTNNRLNE